MPKSIKTGTCKGLIRRWLLSSIFLLTLSIGAGVSQAQDFTHIGNFGGHGYYLSTGTGTWIQSQVKAVNAGLTLVHISSAAENTFVTSHVSVLAWIGLGTGLAFTNSPTDLNIYRWSDSVADAFTYWGVINSVQMPDNSGGLQRCALINSAGVVPSDAWDDANPSVETYAVAEGPLCGIADITLTASTINLGSSVNSVTLTGITSVANPTFSWSGNGAAFLSSLTSATTVFTPTSIGTYNLILTVANALTGCSASLNKTVTVVAAPDVPVITCPGDVAINSCSPASVSTDPSSTGYATATGSCATTITYSDVSSSSSPVAQTTSSAISSNFNGTAIAAGRYIWFHNHIDLTSYPSTDFQVFITGSTITGTVNNAPFTLAAPKSTISFSHSATTASYNFTGGQWFITIPWSEIGNGEIFSGGVAYPVPAGGIQGGANPVTWTQSYSTSSSSTVGMKWQWSAAVYTNFTAGYNALGVTLLHQSLHAGTPTNYSSFVTGGARGGGGSNFTGSWSATGSVNASAASGCAYLMIKRTWKATDCNGKTSTCDQIITVKDMTPPVAICKNKTVTLVNGSASITAADIDNGSNDNCSAVTLVGVSPSSFDCDDAGQNVPVTLTVKDACGNTSTCTSSVTVIGVKPTCSIAVAPSNNTYTGGIATNIYLGYGPQKATLTANAAGSGLTYLWTGPTSKLSCTNCKSPTFTPTTGGIYNFTVQVTNSYGCTSTCLVTFCVKDVRVPGSNNVYVCQLAGTPPVASTLSVTASQAATLLANPDNQLGMCNQTCGAIVTARMMPANVVGDEVKVYPNPNNGSFFVELPYIEDQGLITITDVQGKTISRRIVTDNDGHKISLDMGNVARGVYFLEVIYGDQRFRTKLIVQ